MSSYKPSDPYVKEFTTSSPTTGAAVNADSLPVATANHNGTDDGTFTLTVTNLDTGRYKVTGTIPAGYAAGDVVGISVAAAVGGVAGKGIVDTFLLDSKRLADLLDVSGYVKVDVIQVAGQNANPTASVTVGGYATGQDPGTLVSAITVAGQTLPNALRHIGATVAGKVAGVGTGTEVFAAFDGTTAVTVTVDINGNRTNIVYG